MHLINEASMRRCFYQYMNCLHDVEESLEEKVIVDTGCGAGIFSVLVSLLGAKRIIAVDHDASCIQMTKYVADIGEIDNIDTVHNYIEELDLPEKSIDGVFCNEAISHFKNHELFLDVISKALRYGGFLIVNDGNNGASPFIKYRHYNAWDIFENSPKATTIHGFGSKSETCYLDLRKDIIRDAFPSLNQKQIERFSRYTFAYSKESTIVAVSQFLKGDFTLRSEFSRVKCPYDPESDFYQERLFNPRELKRELSDYGFKSKIRSIGPSRKAFRLIRYFWELLSPITIYFPRPFRLIAKKQSKS